MPDNITEARRDRVADAIERYLADHPDAADTERGITAWWLPTMNVDATADEVQGALDRLRELGVVDAQPIADGSVIYRAAGTRGGSDR